MTNRESEGVCSMGRVFLIVLFLGSCFKDPGRSGRPIIRDFTKDSPSAASGEESEEEIANTACPSQQECDRQQ